jgi:DNA polymerase
MPVSHYPTASLWLPAERTIPALREASKDCQGCDLYKNATQTVFGEGPVDSALMLVGEQPGDREDLRGAPFVGPAGRILDRALADAGIVRGQVYLTNAVKHFKWKPDGEHRTHAGPGVGEVRACRPWLEAEIDAVRPQLIGCMGRVAVESLLGSTVKVRRTAARSSRALTVPVSSLCTRRRYCAWRAASSAPLPTTCSSATCAAAPNL